MTVCPAPARKISLTRLWRSPWFDLVQFLTVLGLLAWFFIRSTERLGYNWHWFRVPQYFYTIQEGKIVWGPLLEGLWVTIQLSACGLILSFILGLITALFRLSSSFSAQLLARGYLELIRNTPLMVQIFFIYFVIGPVFGLERFASAVLALSLFEGAYASEIFRAGIVSIHKGQWEASYSLGLSPFQMYTHVILPQAMRRILPPLTSQAISLIKDSALVSTIAIYDLTMQTMALVSETFLAFELWFATAGIYLVITVALSLLVNYMENHFRLET